MNSFDYWQQREEEQRKHNITEEKEYDREVERIYRKMLSEISDQIYAWYAKYASEEGITMAEAKRLANKLDIKAYAEKAKEYVKNKDFSDEANSDMKIYNLTMKANRLELLKAHLGLELAEGNDEIRKFFKDKLDGRTLDELERQAGILGNTIRDNQDLVHSIVNASFHNATFSDRIWMNQELLRYDLDKILSTALIQGKNPRDFISQVRKRFDVTAHNAERLLRTELARVQTGSQMRSYTENGFDEYTFHALGTACPDCLALNGKHFKVKEAEPSVNCSPMHPNCRCSTSPYLDSTEFDKWLEGIDEHGLTFEEWKREQKDIEFTSSLSDFKNAMTKRGAIDFAQKRLELQTSNSKSIFLKTINEVNRSLSNIFKDYPSLKGFIQEISFEPPKSTGIAEFGVRWNRGKVSTIIRMNPDYFKDYDYLIKTIERNVKSGYFSNKKGVEGILRHEMAHALEVKSLFKIYSCDPFSQDEKNSSLRYSILEKFQNSVFSNDVVKQVMYNLGLRPNIDDLEKYVSFYAAKSFAQSGSLREAFAEILSDGNQGELYNELIRVLKERGVF